MSDIESRGGIRVRIDTPAVLEIDREMRETIRILRDSQRITVIDVSVVGAGILSPVFLPKGAMLSIRMETAVFSPGAPVEIKGEVKYCRPVKQGSYKVGVRFVDIEDNLLNKIKVFVDKSEGR